MGEIPKDNIINGTVTVGQINSTTWEWLAGEKKKKSPGACLVLVVNKPRRKKSFKIRENKSGNRKK